MRIALIVDNPMRDLPGLVLVGAHLVNAGATVYLVPMNLQQWEVFSLAPDYVLVNYCRKNNEVLLGRMMRAGIRVGVLDTEGGVLSSLESYGQTLASDAFVRASVTSFMSWGPVLADFAVRSRWFEPGQVDVTGSPRFDFYHKGWRSAALRFTNISGDQQQPLVMFNGNFPLANPQFYTRAEERKQLVRAFGFTAEEVDAWQTAQANGLKGLTTLANTLAKTFSAVRFVYRPHPFESLEPYRGLLEPVSNLELVRKGTVDTWLLRSSAVIQRSCSTAIEAAMAGTVALSPSWLPTAREMVAANAVSYCCATPEEMKDVLRSVLSGTFTPPPAIRHALTRIIDDWFTAVDGQAGERVARTILNGLPSRRNGRLRVRCTSALYGLESRPRQKLVGALRKGLGIPPHFSFRPWANKRNNWDSSAKFFGKTEVEHILTAIVHASPSHQMKAIRIAHAVDAVAEKSGYPLRSLALFPARLQGAVSDDATR